MNSINDELRARGRSDRWHRAYAGGTFDCLHRGHLAFLTHAKRLARELVVSVNTDEFAERYKRRPLMPLADRLSVLGALKMVDRVIVNDGGEDSRPAILRASPDVIVHGDDWVGDAYLRQLGLDQSWLDEHGIAVTYVPYSRVTSSSVILDRWTHYTCNPLTPRQRIAEAERED